MGLTALLYSIRIHIQIYVYIVMHWFSYIFYFCTILYQALRRTPARCTLLWCSFTVSRAPLDILSIVSNLMRYSTSQIQWKKFYTFLACSCAATVTAQVQSSSSIEWVFLTSVTFSLHCLEMSLMCLSIPDSPSDVSSFPCWVSVACGIQIVGQHRGPCVRYSPGCCWFDPWTVELTLTSLWLFSC